MVVIKCTAENRKARRRCRDCGYSAIVVTRIVPRGHEPVYLPTADEIQEKKDAIRAENEALGGRSCRRRGFDPVEMMLCKHPEGT